MVRGLWGGGVGEGKGVRECVWGGDVEGERGTEWVGRGSKEKKKREKTVKVKGKIF